MINQYLRRHIVHLTMALGLISSPAMSQMIPIGSPIGLPIAVPGGPATYTLIDLGTLGGSSSTATGIDSTGNVVGYSTTADGSTHAFYYDVLAGTLTDLGTLGGTTSQASALNDSGTITGSASLADGSTHAFAFSNGVMTDLGALDTFNTDGYSYGQGIDSSGNIIGYSHTAGGDHGFWYSNGTLTDLGVGANGVYAFGLNDSGVVTGSFDVNGSQHAFSFSSGTTVDLGTLGGPSSVGRHVDAYGDIVGRADTASNGSGHAFLYSGGTLTDLGTLGGSQSDALWINNSGWVTGSSGTMGDADTHAYLYDGTTLSDLNTLIDPNDPLAPYVTLQQGAAINDGGVLAVVGIDARTGQTHAYLVRPNVLNTDGIVMPTVMAASGANESANTGGGGATGTVELGLLLSLLLARGLKARACRSR